MDPHALPPMPQPLEGKLLLAETTLRAPAFRRSVIFLTHHGSEGSHGYVLNQPLDRQVHHLLSGEEFAPLAEVEVFQGGPVDTERLTFATLGWDQKQNTLSFQSHLSSEAARDAHLAGKDVRAFIGYSGWSPGQLENEIERHSWIVTDPAPPLADPDAIPYLWPAILRGMGPFFSLVALTPDAPERN